MPHNKRAEKQHSVKTDQRSLLCPLKAVFVCFLACHHAYWSCTHYRAIIATSEQKEKKILLEWNKHIYWGMFQKHQQTKGLRHIYCWYLLPIYWNTAVLSFTLHFECIKILNIWWGWVRFPVFPCHVGADEMEWLTCGLFKVNKSLTTDNW